MDRRRLLTGVAGALAAALAGCSSGGDGDGDGTAPTATQSTTATAAPETTTDGATEAETTTGETTTEGTDGTTTDSAAAVVVTVAPGGSLEFDPETVTIDAGGTVRWEWDAGGHNVRVSTQPEAANWTGTEGTNTDTYGSGHVYEFTFDVAGTYEYFCAPHRAAGMTGTVVVE